MVKKDPYLMQLRSRLPKGWTFEQSGDQLRLASQSACYVLAENRNNAPIRKETEDERKARFRMYGKKTHAFFQFSIRKKRNKADILEGITHNKGITREIRELEKKYEIAKLKSPYKGEYIASSEAEEKQLLRFLEEKEKINKNRKRLPDFVGAVCELYLEEQEGLETDLESVFPVAVAQEAWQVKELLGEVLITPLFSGECFSAYKNRIVTFFGKLSALYNQHVVLYFMRYPESHYIDTDCGQIIVYAAEQITREDDLWITGKVVEAKWNSGKLSEGEEYSEYHVTAYHIE